MTRDEFLNRCQVRYLDRVLEGRPIRLRSLNERELSAYHEESLKLLRDDRGSAFSRARLVQLTVVDEQNQLLFEQSPAEIERLLNVDAAWMSRVWTWAMEHCGFVTVDEKKSD